MSMKVDSDKRFICEEIRSAYLIFEASMQHHFTHGSWLVESELNFIFIEIVLFEKLENKTRSLYIVLSLNFKLFSDVTDENAIQSTIWKKNLVQVKNFGKSHNQNFGR